MKKTIIRLAGMLCALLVGAGFTACDHDNDYDTVADSVLIGTWDTADGYDEALGETIPGYEYIFQTMNYDESEYKDDDPDTFEGVDRPVRYDRIVFSADMDGGLATFYTKDASGNYVEGARYIARFLETTISLYNIEKTVVEEIKDEDGNVIETVEKVVPDLTLFKEYAVEKLEGNELKIVWNKSERIVVTYTNQYESYHLNKVK